MYRSVERDEWIGQAKEKTSEDSSFLICNMEGIVFMSESVLLVLQNFNWKCGTRVGLHFL